MLQLYSIKIVRSMVDFHPYIGLNCSANGRNSARLFDEVAVCRRNDRALAVAEGKLLKG
jgi:hypothetical protein